MATQPDGSVLIDNGASIADEQLTSDDREAFDLAAVLCQPGDLCGRGEGGKRVAGARPDRGGLAGSRAYTQLTIVNLLDDPLAANVNSCE